METFNIELVFPTEALRANNSSFFKLLLVTNDIGNTPGKEGPLFAEGEEPEAQRNLLLTALSQAHIKELAPTL